MEQLYRETFDRVRMPEERVQALRKELAACCEGEDRRNRANRPAKRRLGTAALAAALVAALCCVGVGAAAVRLLLTEEQQAAFYQVIFGNQARETQEALYEEDEAGRILVNLPAAERVPVDQAEAAELIGPYLSEEVYVLTGKGYTLTVEGYVFDRNTGTGQLYFSLENPNGISGICVGEGDHEIWSDGTGINWMCSGASHVYLDAERSTDTKYYVIVPLAMWDPDAVDELQVKLLWRDSGRQNGWETLGQAGLPVKGEMPYAALEQDGLRASCSAIGMCLTGFETDQVNYIALEYQDGSRYVLLDKAANLDNTSYRLAAGADVGLEQEEYRLVFNRLVDVSQVAGVQVDGLRLTAQEAGW